MATITLAGDPIQTCGDLPAVGSMAPDFTLTDVNLKDVGLADFRGKKVILNITPSLDTGICATSAKTFDEAAKKRDDLVVLNVSADLPFAQQRFCQAEGIDNVKTLSMMRDRHFAKDYGVLVETGPTAGITCRAVVVIDESGKVCHTELVPEIKQEPDYQAALKALD